jgi:hypothetical protein
MKHLMKRKLVVVGGTSIHGLFFCFSEKVLLSNYLPNFPKVAADAIKTPTQASFSNENGEVALHGNERLFSESKRMANDDKERVHIQVNCYRHQLQL